VDELEIRRVREATGAESKGARPAGLELDDAGELDHVRVLSTERASSERSAPHSLGHSCLEAHALTIGSKELHDASRKFLVVRVTIDRVRVVGQRLVALEVEWGKGPLDPLAHPSSASLQALLAGPLPSVHVFRTVPTTLRCPCKSKDVLAAGGTAWAGN